MWLRVQEIMGESVTVLQENLVGIHVVKAFGAEAYEEQKYDRKAQELREHYFQSERLQETNGAWMSLYFTCTLGAIVWYGGSEVIHGHLTAGGLTQFILYMNQLAFPIRAAARVIDSISRAISSGQRLFEVFDASSPVAEKSDATEMGRARGHVRFEHVSFSYGARIPALKQITVEAIPGQITAILGAPGSGKSTIVNLLPRFYDVTEGRISIDGRDIRDFTLQSLRRNVGIVQQDVYLFGATIRDNIAYGAVGASFDDVVRAATIAQLHDQITQLPEGYDTWVDVETERRIHQAMIAVMQNRTTFVIAHRLSTVRRADLILVLQDGEIVEQGSHQELMARQGLYYEIYELQLRPQAELLLDEAKLPDTGGKG